MVVSTRFVEDLRRSVRGFAPGAFVRRGFFPPSSVLVGTMEMDEGESVALSACGSLSSGEDAFLFLFLGMILLESVAPWILAMMAHLNRMDRTARMSLTDFSQLGASNHDVERRAKEWPAPSYTKAGDLVCSMFPSSLRDSTYSSHPSVKTAAFDTVCGPCQSPVGFSLACRKIYKTFKHPSYAWVIS